MNIPDFSTARVAVIGDYIIDEYWHCTSERISPEAPVPVCQIVKTEQRAGGAGNVERGVVKMGGKCHLTAVVRPEHRKVRVVVGKHQVARVDYTPDRVEYFNAWEHKDDDIRNAVAQHNVVVISDYGRMPQSSIRFAIEEAKRQRRFVIVDPKRPDPKLYAGAELITPNEKEWQALGERLPPGNQYALVTLGERGMVLYRKGEKPVKIETVARDVIDVTGAGDTVVATVATALSAGYPIVEAVRYANIAAGIAVEHFGTYAVSIEELRGRIDE